MANHAILSPSAAHRWLHCTAAPRLEEGVEDRGSDYAAEGTLAHAYCAKKLKEFLGQDTTGEDEEIHDLFAKYHTGEMDEYTDTYKTIVLEKYNAARAKVKDALLLVEVRLDFSGFMPEAFGTADAVIIADGTMEIIDFKYGKGVKVSAVNNPQMQIYALGAHDAYSFEYNIKNIKMTIVQPRLDNLSEFEMAAKDLLAWATKELMPKAAEAFKGDGKQIPGAWCQFCKVKSRCLALADMCITTSNKYAGDPRLISNEEIATGILHIVSTIKTWLAGIEEYVLQQALAGVDFKGYKVVEGRSVRRITDQEKVISVLSERGYKVEDYLKPLELRSITDLEKTIGKKLFNELCGQYIAKPSGKPTLVPSDDKRPAYNAAAEDFKEINI